MKFYDAERILFPLLNKKKDVTIKELVEYAKRLEARCKGNCHFDTSYSSISNAIKLYNAPVKFNKYRVWVCDTTIGK